MKLSILLSGIRVANWTKLYESIGKSYTKGSWELIIISPYDLPQNLLDKPNIQWRRDWGSPVRCQQIALTMSQGDWINWASDDGWFTEGSMDISMKLLENKSYTTVIVGRYREGDGDTNDMVQDGYYLLNNHLGSQCKYLPTETPLLNVGLVSRELLFEVGGWDSTIFEVLPYAYNDLACRLKNLECEFILQKEVMFECGHMPGETGDHGPIHRAQVFKDEPMFKLIYCKPDSVSRKNIYLDNWEKSPSKWVRRFGL